MPAVYVCILYLKHNALLLNKYLSTEQLFTNMRTITLLILFIPFIANGQTVCSQESRNRLDSTLLEISNLDLSKKPIREVVMDVGTGFLNTPYVEKTLEIEGDEKLVINLMGLDCTTFLESVVTLARVAKLRNFAFEDYEKELEFLRYRDGENKGYPSRLHYFSDWIYDNQQKGILSDITREIGGELYANNPAFMSENPKFYPQLTNKEFVDQLKKTETKISSRTYYYIPKESVESHEDKIQSGDLIAITISMDNLDISHVGFAVEHEGRIHLMHASSKLKKVVISEKPLSDYLIGNKSQSGIMVCRLVEPE